MIIFKTPGSLSLEQALSFGTSVKSEGAIGFFGTGLKYALAILMRLNAQVVICTDGKAYPVNTAKKELRGATFDFIRVGRTLSGFTTELGKTWEAWEAYRELESNTRDEGGETIHRAGGTLPKPEPDYTTITIVCPEFEQVWANREQVFLPTVGLIGGSDVLEVHGNSSKYLYYKGIRAFNLDKPTLLTYNYVGTKNLTENRTISNPYTVEMAARRAVIRLPVDMALRVMSAPEGYEESSWNWSYLVSDFSEELMAALLPLARERRPGLNQTLINPVLAHARTLGNRSGELVSARLDRLDQQRLNKAISFLQRLGYTVEEYPIVVTDLLADSILGLAHEGTIFLSHRVFLLGTPMVAGTILEEYIHLKRNLSDESRSLQNYLFDTIIRLGERVLDEAL